MTIALVAVFAACNGDDETDDSATPPLPTRPVSTTPPSSDLGPSSTDSTVAESSTSSLNPVPTITDPPVATTAPIEVPPVSTLVPEVSADLLTPEQLDPASPNNSRPILPEHLPVIEAHLRGLQAATLVSSTWPVDPESPELLGAPLTPETLQQAQEAAQGRRERGEVLNVTQGVTFRPYVVGPVTDTAVVYDCELAGHYWTKADTGELLPPTEIWPAGPGRIVELGLRDTFVLRDGRWLLAASQIDPGACA